MATQCQVTLMRMVEALPREEQILFFNVLASTTKTAAKMIRMEELSLDISIPDIARSLYHDQDLYDAYAAVNRESMFESLEEMETPVQLLAVFESLEAQN